MDYEIEEELKSLKLSELEEYSAWVEILASKDIDHYNCVAFYQDPNLYLFDTAGVIVLNQKKNKADWDEFKVRVIPPRHKVSFWND